MRTLTRQLILLTCFAAFVSAAGGEEPSYHGHSFSEWAGQLDPHLAYEVHHPPPAVVAIRHVGTNALPILLKWISEKDPNGTSCLLPSNGTRAVMALSILGDAACPAVPELTKLAMTLPDRERYHRCIQALAYIGPKSLPSFITILTKGRPGACFSAIEWLPVFHSNAVVALPAVIKCLAGKNDEVGWKAADELSRLDVPSAILVPALTNALPSASAPARARILRCLFWLDPPARAAGPAIRAALIDPRRQVREEATIALQKIAPELLPNAPPK